MHVFPVLLITLMAAEITARLTADREAVWSGVIMGLCVSAVGLYFALKMVKRHRASPVRPAGKGDIWGFWSLGFAARMVLTLICAWLLLVRFGDRALLAIFPLMAVYALTLAAETCWLYRIFSEQPSTGSASRQ